MQKLITIAEFSNSHDIKFSLLKDMLEQAKIDYFVVNENARNVEPFLISPSNIAIEIKVYEKNAERALEIVDSLD